MPTPGQIQEAVQFPATAFRDPDLAAATPDTDVLGLPRARTGAFAAVFRLAGPSGEWAVKVFTDADASRGARYAALARRLRAHPVPEIVPFELQEAGIVVDGRAAPLVKMPWQDGLPLGAYVARHRADAARMRALADAWADLVARMEAAGIAHGDLQHGNILVVEDDAKAPGDGGTANASQAPVAEPPALSLSKGEARAADAPRPAFRLVDLDAVVVPGAPPPSEAGHRNYAHPDRAAERATAHPDRFPALVVYTALRALERHPALWHDHDSGENLLFRADDFLDPDASPLVATLAADDVLAPFAAALRAAAFGPLRRVPPLAGVLGDLAAGRTPEAPRQRRSGPHAHRRSRAEAAALPVLAAALVAAAAIGTATTPAVGAVLAAVTLAVFAATALFGARRLPLARHRRRVGAERRRLSGDLAALDDRLAAAEAERAAVLSDAGAHQARRLAELRREALHDRLRHHFIDEATAFVGTDGQRITPRIVVRLKNVGVRTAWEVEAPRVARAPDLSDGARARVLAWRASLDVRYADGLPTELAEGEIRRLDRMRAHRADDLARDAERLAIRRAAVATEDAALAARLDAIPQYGAAAYAAYLLRLAASPPSPHISAPRPPAGESPARANAAVLAARPLDPDAPWWNDASATPTSGAEIGATEPGTASSTLDS